MARDLGVKHTCFNCETRFYDLHKPQAICPKCGADQRDAASSKPRPAAEKRRARAVEEEAPEAEELEVAAPDEESDEEAEEEDLEESADEEP